MERFLYPCQFINEKTLSFIIPESKWNFCYLVFRYRDQKDSTTKDCERGADEVLVAVNATIKSTSLAEHNRKFNN